MLRELERMDPIDKAEEEEKLEALEEMIRTAPKHKSSEKMLANLKTRYVKLKKEIETEKSKKKGTIVFF